MYCNKSIIEVQSLAETGAGIVSTALVDRGNVQFM